MPAFVVVRFTSVQRNLIVGLRWGHAQTARAIRRRTRSSDSDARFWEIAEKLHRAELSKIERDELVAEWINITDASKPAQVGQVSGGPGNEGGVSAAARNLLASRKDRPHFKGHS